MAETMAAMSRIQKSHFLLGTLIVVKNQRPTPSPIPEQDSGMGLGGGWLITVFEVLALLAAEGGFASLQALGHGGIHVLRAAGHASRGAVASSLAEQAGARDVLGDVVLLHAHGGLRGDGGLEDGEIVNLHGRSVQRQLADAACSSDEHTSDGVDGEGRTMVGDVLRQLGDANRLHVGHAGVDLAEVAGFLVLVFVKVKT